MPGGLKQSSTFLIQKSTFPVRVYHNFVLIAGGPLMLKKKYHTTPLLLPHQQKPIEIIEPARPSSFRAFQILRFYLKARWQARYGRGRGNLEEQAVIWRQFFEKMGGLWIKIGQLIAMRTDLYSKELTGELSSLQHRSQGFPFSHAIKSIEQSIGAPIEEIFIELNEKPLAAASMAQIHKGRLRYNGRPIVVKVLRPYAKELLEADLKIFKRLFNFLSRFKSYQQAMLDDMIWELEIMLMEEADFRYEANNLREAKKRFRKYGIYVPKVYKRFCSEKVVVMEYIPGVSMSEYIRCRKEYPGRLQEWIKENKIKPRNLGSHLMKCVWRQAMEDNFFHGDLQPGNIMLLRKNRLALIDLGSVGILDRDSLKSSYEYLSASSTKDYAGAAKAFMQSLPFVPSEHRIEIQKSMERGVKAAMRKASITDVDIDQKTTFHLSNKELNREIASYGVPPNWEALKLNRLFTTIDPSVVELHPKINLEKEWKAFQKEGQIRNKDGSSSNVFESMDNYSALLNINSRVIIRHAFEIKDKVDGNIRLAIAFLNFLKWGLVIILLFLLWNYLYQHHEVLQSLHAQYDHWLLRKIEGMPTFPKGFWYGFMAVALFILWRFIRFIPSLRNPTLRH